MCFVLSSLTRQKVNIDMYPLYTCGFCMDTCSYIFLVDFAPCLLLIIVMDECQHCSLSTLELEVSLYVTSAVNTMFFLRKANINLNFLPEIRVCVEITHAYMIRSIGGAANENQA